MHVSVWRNIEFEKSCVEHSWVILLLVIYINNNNNNYRKYVVVQKRVEINMKNRQTCETRFSGDLEDELIIVITNGKRMVRHNNNNNNLQLFTFYRKDP